MTEDITSLGFKSADEYILGTYFKENGEYEIRVSDYPFVNISSHIE